MKGTWFFVGAVAVIALVRAPRVIQLMQFGSMADRVTSAAFLAVVAVAFLMARGDIGWTLPDQSSRIAAGLIATVLGVAFFAPILSGHSPHGIDVTRQLVGPGWQHWMGTDLLGRDFLTRVLYGLRTSVIIAITATTITIVIGTLVGTTAALHPRIGALLMRLVDAGLAFPRVILLLLLFSFWSSLSIPATIIILGLTGWYRTSRLIRAETMVIAGQNYLHAAGAIGMSGWRRLVRHIVPNLTPILIVSWVLSVGNIMLIESGLAFLGLGVKLPTPSLGRMITDGTEYLSTDIRLAIVPGIAIGLTVIAFGLLGDRLQRTFDPRLQ